MRSDQILMFGGRQPTPITVFYPISKKKKCVRCKKLNTDFIGLACVECVSKSIKKEEKNNGRTKK